MELKEENKDEDKTTEEIKNETEELLKKYEKLNRPNYFEMMMNGEFSNIQNIKSTSEQN